MLGHDTDYEACLLQMEGEDKQRATRKKSRWRKAETLVTITLLFLSGVGTGYIYKARIDESLMAQQRDDHLQEIARLQEAQSLALENTARSIDRAAATAAVVTDKTAANTETLTNLAKRVDKSIESKK